MIGDLVTDLITSAQLLLTGLTDVFSDVVVLIYDGGFTTLGEIVVATAGFALAWAGIRFVFGFVNRLLNKTRAGR